MEWLTKLVDLILHVDKHLDALISQYDTWTYLILTLIVFAETGLVFTPFLPGDSLLFAAGALSGRENAILHPGLLFGILTGAAILGDNTNYWIGRTVGAHILRKGGDRFIRKQYLDRTHEFFARYGVAAIIMARFVPIVRTFMPFVAGLGAMNYRTFLPFDILGGVLWVGICVFAGYFFGRHELVQKNFSLVVLAIIFVSILPGIIGLLRVRAQQRREMKQAAQTPEQP